MPDRPLSPPRRSYLADDVFEAVAREILRGERKPGEALPSERVLSERFGVSKLLVRQALHRLAAAELVRVRQGDVTRVLDPSGSPSLAVIELYYRLAPESDAARGITRDVLEKQYTQGLSLCEVFERRANDEARRALVDLVAVPVTTEEELAALEERFWTAVARGGENRILQAETAFWYRALVARPKMPSAAPPGARAAFYAELARRFAAREHPVAFYVAALAPVMNALSHELEPGSSG